MPTFTLNGTPLPYAPFATGTGEDVINHPPQVLDLWSDADLAAIGVVRTPDPPAPTVRRDIPKSTIAARLRAINKFTAVWTIINSNHDLFDQWYTPDWPRVYFDDAGMLAVLNAAGLTADEIAQVTA